MRRQLAVLGALIAAVACQPNGGRSADGEAIFGRTCARCHAADGMGDPIVRARLPVPNMTDPAWQARLTDGDIRRTVRQGSKSKKMPAFGRAFSERQLDGLVRKVRQLAKR